MRQLISLCRALAAVLCCCGAAAAQPTEKTLFVTNNVGSPGSLTVFRVGMDGSLTFVNEYSGVGVNPQDCGVTDDGTRVIVLNATASVTTEDIYTATVNADSTINVNPVPSTVGDGPLALHITRDDYLLVPSATAHTLSSYLINAGSTSFINSAFAGNFPTKPIATPDGKFAYSIGSSAPNDVCTFTIGGMGELTNVGCVDISGGGGFGAAVHPSGDTLYVSLGLQNLINQYDINTSTGALTFAKAHASGETGNNSAVELEMHPAGTYMYVCHVVSDTLSVLRVNTDRSLTTMGLTYTIGSDIRDVVTDGTFVFVTDESSTGGSPVGVIVYRIEGDGSLTALGPAVNTQGVRPQFMAVWPSAPPPPCEGDADGDGDVDFGDITKTLEFWGSSGPEGDADHDGDVDFGDITSALENWGSCS